MRHHLQWRLVALTLGLVLAAPLPGAATPVPYETLVHRVAGSKPKPARHPPVRRTDARPVSTLQTVQAGNSQARATPKAGDYQNAALFYDYEPGRLYAVHTSPRFLTAITLAPGEKLISKAAGDTVRWVMGETAQGVGSSAQVVIFLKPIRGGLRTNIILTTDQRTYLLDAVSHEGETYTSVVSWNYPADDLKIARAAGQAIVAASIPIDQLNFSYKIRSLARPGPRWQPLRVFDDGLKTYIQFPADLASTDAPPLFLLGPGKSAQLVNYRAVNGYYIVDRLIDVAELRLGERPQVIVRITRDRQGH